MVNPSSYKDCWAKTNPYQSVYAHGIVSGTIAQVLYDKYLSPGQRKKLQTALQMPTADILRHFIGYMTLVRSNSASKPRVSKCWS